MPPLIDPHSGQDLGFDSALARSGRLPPVNPSELTASDVRWNRRRELATRKAVLRSHWWYPIVLVLAIAAIGYSTLRTDQRLAAVLIWPTEGSQFVEVGGSALDPAYRDTLVVVAGGLNRKSGNLIADALMPSVGGPNARVFSLKYGSGIYDDDINTKFDALFRRYQPNNLVFVGSSMGGDVVLNIAEHFQQTFADPTLYQAGQIVPSIDTIYLDCTPMSTDDVRYAARTQADFLTGLTEKLGTDGGAGTRLTAEMLTQRKQWSAGNYPFLRIQGSDFVYKWDQVWREKLNPTGVSTALVKDQYGVIRRFGADRVLGELGAGTDVVYLRPDLGGNDNTIDVDQVETRLRLLATLNELDLTVIDVPGGSHASAVRDAAVYNSLISAYQRSADWVRIGQLVR